MNCNISSYLRVNGTARSASVPYHGSVRIDSDTTYLEAEISVDTSSISVPIYLEHNEEKTLRISVVHAGGATLPVNFVVQGGLAFEETGGPGW